MWPFDLHLNQIQNCHTTFDIIKVLETKCGTTKILLHSFLSLENMNPQLTCSHCQWRHSSVGRASHRYREIMGSNPVEVLNFFFQASLRNCINCIHCDDHFFIFIFIRAIVSEVPLMYGIVAVVTGPELV